MVIPLEKPGGEKWFLSVCVYGVGGFCCSGSYMVSVTGSAGNIRSQLACIPGFSDHCLLDSYCISLIEHGLI